VSPRLAMLSAPTMTAQRQERYGSRPGIAPFCLIGRTFLLRSALILPRRAADHRAGCGRQRYPGSPSRASIPSPISRNHGSPRVASLSRPARAGAVWRFRNEGNRALSWRIRKSTGPSFGGYGPGRSGTEGVTYAGNPRFWVGHGARRLYTCSGREENAPRSLPSRRVS
jgi:hypothetical protein